MSSTLQLISVSASNIATFEDCQARYYHEEQRYEDGTLATDRVAADVSRAVHDALMMHHRQIEQEQRRGSLPTISASRARLWTLVDQHLRRKRLDRSNTDVAGRLARLEVGIDRVAGLIVADASRWAVDSRGDLLVWAEAPLDHGPTIRAIELEVGSLVRTRPDVIGMWADGAGRHRAVVRDFKARNEVVDPAFETGILLRAIWAVLELRSPRCRWFLGDRDIRVDADRVDLETVNLMHATGEDFLVRATLTADQLLAHRDRFVQTLGDMTVVRRADCADTVLASPGGLCLHWCPFLDRCDPGMAHVRKYSGEDVLQIRLGGR